MENPKTFPEINNLADDMKRKALEQAVYGSVCVDEAAFKVGLKRNGFASACQRYGVCYDSIKDPRGAALNLSRDMLMVQQRKKGRSYGEIGRMFGMSRHGAEHAVKRTVERFSL